MKVFELFQDESNWTQLALARNAAGESIDPNDPEAVCWCLYGAIMKCYPFGERGLMAMDVQKYIERGSALTFNDQMGRKFQEVKDLVARANI